MNGNEAENEPFDFALFGERERECVSGIYRRENCVSDDVSMGRGG